MRTVLYANPGQFGLLGFLEKDRTTSQTNLGTLEGTVVFQPVPGAGVQVVLGPSIGMPGFVTDDVHLDIVTDQLSETLQRPRHRLCLCHPSAIDIALQLGPGVFLTGAPQLVTDRRFGWFRRGRHQSLFHSHAVKQPVVTNDRVVKINTDNHVRLAALSSCFVIFMTSESTVSPYCSRA